MKYDKALSAFVELAASRHNALHTLEAAEIINPRRLRRAELEGFVYRLHPQVWAITSLPSSKEQVLRGAALSIGKAAATTTSAAWLHGWTNEPPTQPQLWVPTERSGNHPVAELRRWSRIDPAIDIVEISSIPTLNAAATLCSLGPHGSTVVLRRCLDEFLRSHSRRWLEETMDRLGSRKPGGVRALRTVIGDPKRVEGVTDSWFERVVADLIAQPWMPPIELQYRVATSSGRYRLDLACPELKLGVEAHSRSYHWRNDQVEADNVRDLELSALGWQLLYVTWTQTQQPEVFARQFAEAARGRAELLGIDLSAA